MKRLCIYLTYDKDSVVDAYIGYMLKELRECADHLAVVCNEEKVEEGIEHIQGYADEIFFRENKGFDAGGFKDALCLFLGWDKVWEYDELILVNDSMFGPFCPMREIFAEMDKRPADFWGIARAEYGACKSNFGRDVPEHIQTYFMAVRTRMLHSDAFRAYWEGMPYYPVFSQLFQEYEFKFTQHFAELGYTYDTLADTKANDSENKDYNYCQYEFISYELIKKRNFPFLKKQQIASDTLEKQTQEQLRLAMEYIHRHTDYKADLIWENIIRTLNMADLQRKLCLQYRISSREEGSEASMDVLVAVILEYKESMEYVLEYLGRLGPGCKIKLFSREEEIRKLYRESGYECREIHKELPELLYGFSGAELVCVIYDEDISTKNRSSCTGKSCFYNRWENLLKDDKHTAGIVRRFEEEARLGFLTYPQPVFADFFGELGEGWKGVFGEVEKIAEELKLKCRISETHPPFRVAESFWIRGSILKRLKDFPAAYSRYLPYLWSYLAQDAGYYSGIVESEAYGAMNEINLQYYLKQTAMQVQRQYGGFRDFFSMKKHIFRGALQEFCGKYSRLLIYGTGYMARAYSSILPRVEGFVVSDGRSRAESLEGLPVRYLSEIADPQSYGLVLCMDEKNQAQVVSELQKRGIENYIGI